HRDRYGLPHPPIALFRPSLVLSADAHAAKMQAMSAFKTQTGHVTPALRNPILPDWALARFRRDFEVYLP
ncbi:hypothetical protein J7401_15340, partial [Xanthomonas phaseoli pv. dieffenbachiae]|nr:hypothetical protein [Xanthomonas phaseoli pv. dieffenbachiae]